MDELRKHIVALLRGGQAYETFDDVISSFPPEHRGVVPPGAERSAWQILEHMRICLRDILDFSRNPDYVELTWPDDYWPAEIEGSWDDTARLYKADLAEMENLVMTADLFEPFPWGKGQTLLREALLAADHQAYHLGQLVILNGLFDRM